MLGFVWNKYLIGRSVAHLTFIDVAYRFPSEAKGQETSFVMTKSHKAATMSALSTMSGLPGVPDYTRRHTAHFTELALKNPTVVMRVTDEKDGEELTFEFSLQGLEEALKQLPCALYTTPATPR
jgi:hypothetical protein